MEIEMFEKQAVGISPTWRDDEQSMLGSVIRGSASGWMITSTSCSPPYQFSQGLRSGLPCKDPDSVYFTLYSYTFHTRERAIVSITTANAAWTIAN